MSNPQQTFGHFVRESLTVGSIIALATAIAVTALAVIDAAADPHHHRPWGNGMVIGPAIVVAFSTVQLLWKGTDAILQQWFARVLGLNFIATVACTLAFVITYSSVTVQYGKAGFQYWFSGGWSTILFPSLLGFGAGLLAALATFVFILLPITAIARPRRLASANMLDTDPRYAKRNTTAGIAMSVLLMLVFLIPTLIVGFDGVAETVGWLLIPVGIGALIVLGINQKSDRARRAAAGYSGLLDMAEDARDEAAK